jgi:sugar-specific transcriptional regulator TrmB
MLSPDKLKRQPSVNTTPQSTTSFDPIDPDEEARQRTDDMEEEEEEVTEAVEEKREGRQKSGGGRNPSPSQK